jgi:hypothetical protein
MNRALALVLVAGLLALAWFGTTRPEMFRGLDARGLAWALMALLLASGAAYGFPRLRNKPAHALAGLLFWAAVIVGIVLVYPLFN